jgi:hypothetical protein
MSVSERRQIRQKEAIWREDLVIGGGVSCVMGDSQVPELASVASPPWRDLDYCDLQFSEDPLGEGGQTVVYEASVPDSEPPETVAVRQLGDRGFTKSVEWGKDGDYEPFLIRRGSGPQ